MDITVRSIHTEEDYETALTDVSEIMDAEPGTREGNRLDALVTLIEAYEACHWAIDPSSVRTDHMNLPT